MVLNLDIGSIMPQYHVVFDDLFLTVSSVERENELLDNWDQLCLENTTLIPTDEAEIDSADAPHGAFKFGWMNPDDRDFAERATTQQEAIRELLQPDATVSTKTTLSGAASTLAPTPPPTSILLQPQSVSSPDDLDALPPLISRAPMFVPPTPIASLAVPVSRNPLLSTAAPVVGRRSSCVNKGTFSKTRYIEEAFLSSAGFMPLTDGHKAKLAYTAELHTCLDTGLMDVLDPRAYASKILKNDADMPTFQQAMNAPDAAEYMNAMKLEIQTLKSQNTWLTGDCQKDKSVLKKGTCAFKLKRLPHGTAYRHKARFSARG